MGLAVLALVVALLAACGDGLRVSGGVVWDGTDEDQDEGATVVVVIKHDPQQPDPQQRTITARLPLAEASEPQRDALAELHETEQAAPCASDAVFYQLQLQRPQGRTDYVSNNWSCQDGETGGHDAGGAQAWIDVAALADFVAMLQ
ncbi:hypothetical protein [Corticibacter populi]|uniref:hypothetical protein n=1 Tax=Corticibacter populi TaxID=1550736 RepID=UPI00102ABBEE|nr:hypothetical protein [Corticibacter populi]